MVGTYVREESYEKCSRTFRIWFPGVSVPSKSSMLFPTLTLTCGK